MPVAGQSGFFCRAARAFEDALARVLIVSQAEKDGRSHLDGPALALMRPFGELDLRDQFGPNEVNLAGRLDEVGERVRGRPAGREQLPDLLVGVGVKAAARLPDVDQPTPS